MTPQPALIDNARFSQNDVNSKEVKMNFLDLPTELILQCIEHEAASEIQALRLTCSHLSEIVTPLLTKRVKVNISSQSLDRLEEISHHHTIRKYIRTVGIDLAYYDAVFAEDFYSYASACADGVYEKAWRWGPMDDSTLYDLTLYYDCDERSDSNLPDNYKISHEWRMIAERSVHRDEDDLTRLQKLLIQCHKEYTILFKDQEKVKENNQHISRIVAALQRFPALHEVYIDDYVEERIKRESVPLDDKFSDSELRLDCLQPHSWKGTPIGFKGNQPVEFMPDFFAALYRSSIFPRSFRITLTTPKTLRDLELSPGQLDYIRKVLDRATHLEFNLYEWDKIRAPHPSDLLDHKHLAALTSAVFAGESVEHLILSVEDKFFRAYRPNITLPQLLPLHTLRWPRLKTLELKYPCHPHEIKRLLDYYGGRLEKLTLHHTLPPSDALPEIMEYARSFPNIKELKADLPRRAKDMKNF